MYEVLKLLERTSIIDVLFYYLLNIHKIKKSPFKIEGAICLIILSDGDGEIRTLDPLLARQVLSQLSYAPK